MMFVPKILIISSLVFSYIILAYCALAIIVKLFLIVRDCRRHYLLNRWWGRKERQDLLRRKNEDDNA